MDEGRRKLEYIKIPVQTLKIQPQKSKMKKLKEGTYKELILLNLWELKSNIIKVGIHQVLSKMEQNKQKRPTWRMPLSISKFQG